MDKRNELSFCLSSGSAFSVAARARAPTAEAGESGERATASRGTTRLAGEPRAVSPALARSSAQLRLRLAAPPPASGDRRVHTAPPAGPVRLHHLDLTHD